MALKRTYTNIDDIPEAARGLYSEVNGEYVLGDDFNIKDPRVDEFRDTNRQLKAQLDQVKSDFGRLQKQFEGVDADEYAQYKEHLSALQEEEERKLLATGQIDELVKRRVARTLDEKNQQLQSKAQAYDQLNEKYTNLSEQYATTQARHQMDALLNQKGLRPRAGARDEVEGARRERRR